MRAIQHPFTIQKIEEDMNNLKIIHYFLLYMAVAGAECNTVIELKLEHHAA